MSLVGGMAYEHTAVRPSKRSDLMVISEMKSSKILRYLAYRHRVGLLAFSAVVLLAYIVWEKTRILF